MLNVQRLFEALDDNDKEKIMRISAGWWENKAQTDAITLTVAEYDMLHGHNKLVETVKMIRARTGCGLVTARDVCVRERQKRTDAKVKHYAGEF